MGLYDRDYMRDEDSPKFVFRRPLSATALLLAANVAAFLLQAVLYGYPPKFHLGPALALNVDELLRGYVWQLLSYQLLHGGLLHLLLNCLGIYMFGRDVEAGLGAKRFLLLYFVSGAIGGVLQVLFSLGWHGHFGGTIVGASAGVFGLVAAFATMFPNRTLTLLLFFLIPVTLRAKTMLLISGAIAIFGILFPGDNIGHAAHLGGMLAGIIFIRQWHLRWGFWPGAQPPPATSRRKDPIGNTQPDAVDSDANTFMSSEVDPILEKIHAHGIHSLTDREREILAKAQARIKRR